MTADQPQPGASGCPSGYQSHVQCSCERLVVTPELRQDILRHMALEESGECDDLPGHVGWLNCETHNREARERLAQFGQPPASEPSESATCPRGYQSHVGCSCKYLHWSEAGGPNECEHGYSEGIPCPRCDAIPLVKSLRAQLADRERELVRVRATVVALTNEGWYSQLQRMERERDHFKFAAETHAAEVEYCRNDRDHWRAEAERYRGAVKYALRFLEMHAEGEHSVAETDGNAWDAAEILRSAFSGGAALDAATPQTAQKSPQDANLSRSGQGLLHRDLETLKTPPDVISEDKGEPAC